MKAGQVAWPALIVMAVIAQAAGATGVLVPEEPNLPPLAIEHHRVRATVEGGVATTDVEEVFRNNTGRRLEATFIFPIPRDAALTDFAMFINGKRQSGKVVEADEARRIYEDIVRRMRDPGLLEFMDCGLLKMRVFPVEPHSPVKVEVRYTHTLPFDNGVYDYTFPMRTGHKASKVQKDMTVTVEISSAQPIKSVYSPSHQVGVTRKDDHHAVAGFEEVGAKLERDFRLFYTVGEKDFGLNLLTHRIEGEEGYFALMIAPRVEMPERDVMPKDVCLVIDVSGSMKQQDRIGSAREAAKFCLQALNPRDRFALITYSTTAEVYGDGLQEATPDAIAKAVEHVAGLEAQGGTALCAATVKALEMAPAGDRPYMVILTTDGEPTVGVTEPDKIMAEVEAANGRNTRVFTFGIAENLNVPLLDRIAEITRGYREYVAPGREIEAKISSFFRKVSHPVLARLELDFGKIEPADVYPPELPDLFRGSQVVAFGRYSGNGHTALRLRGSMGDREKEFVYDATFPKSNQGNDFLPQLWAQRKIGYLLDQIRLHGESDELKDEAIRLSRKFGVATPYTSYLVLEDEAAYRRHGLMRENALDALRQAGVGGRGPAPEAAPEPRDRLFNYPDRSFWAEEAESGQDAAEISRLLRDWKGAEAAGAVPDAVTVRQVDGKTFLRLGNAFVDTTYDESLEELEIMWGSDAYFNLIEARPDLTHYLALGETVVVVVAEKAVIISDRGAEDLSVRDIELQLAETE